MLLAFPSFVVPQYATGHMTVHGLVAAVSVLPFFPRCRYAGHEVGESGAGLACSGISDRDCMVS